MTDHVCTVPICGVCQLRAQGATVTFEKKAAAPEREVPGQVKGGMGPTGAVAESEGGAEDELPQADPWRAVGRSVYFCGLGPVLQVVSDRQAIRYAQVMNQVEAEGPRGDTRVGWARAALEA